MTHKLIKTENYLIEHMVREFIPYEQALELKELGFDEPCFFAFDSCSTPMRCTDLRTNEQKFYGVNYNSSTYTSQPTFSQAFRWFRDKKLSDMCVCRYQGRDDGGVYYYYCITNDFGVEETRHFQEGFFTYEEAELACLKKLIEIIKNK